MGVGHLGFVAPRGGLGERGLSYLSRMMAIVSMLAAAVIGAVATFVLGLGIMALFRLYPPSGHYLMFGGRINLNFSAPARVMTCSHAAPGRIITCNLPPNFFDNLYNLIQSVVSMTPAILMCYGLYQAALCFFALSRRRFLEAKTIVRLRNFSFSGLMFVLISPNIAWLLSELSAFCGWVQARAIMAHLPNTPVHVDYGGPPIYNGLFRLFEAPSLSALLIVVYAFTLTIIVAVMAKASAMAEDHAQIV